MSRDDSSDSQDALAETLPPEAATPGGAVTPLGATAADSLRMTARSIAPATKIGRFVVLDQLGRGGMGVVVAAFDPQLDRKVAIKMLHDNVTAMQGVRLEREAKAMAQLNHPNVVTIHETGTFEGNLYIAMEYVDGQTFGQWLRAKPRTHAEVFDVMMQAGRGLAAAHAKGLVHRDFKPDNVLVGKDGRARVSDFGLVSSAMDQVLVAAAAAVPIVRSTPTQLTLTGSVMGTPLYMAPEQHGGKVADDKADQFSYCVTLWQALCDDMPYGADTYDDLVANVTGGKLKAIPRGVNVSAKLKVILARGLSADPADRFPSMQTLLAALDRARRTRRWPLVAAVGGVGVVGAFVAGVLVLHGRAAEVADPCATAGDQHAWKPQQLAGHDAIKAAVDRYVADWSAHRVATCRAPQSAELLDLRMRCLDDRLAGVQALVARFSELATREDEFRALDLARGLPGFADCDDATRLRATIPLPADPAKRTRIADLEQRTAEAVSFDKMGQWAKAEALVGPLEREAHEVGYAPLEAKLVLLRAGEQYHDGDLTTAEQSYRDAAETAARARDDERIAQAWTDLVSVYAARGKYADALGLVTIARTATERVSDRPLLGARFSNALAGIYLAQGKYPDAKQEYAHALELAQKDGGNNELVGPALTNMGMIQWYVGDPISAAKYFEQGRAWFVARYGPQHPSLGYVHRNLGDLAAQKPDLPVAIGHYEQALAIFEAAHGPDHIDVAIALDPLVYAYAHTGQLDKARATGERALALRVKKLGPDHVSLAVPLTNLADADLIENTPASIARGDERLTHALALEEAAYGKDGPQLPDTLERLADARERLGKHTQAFAALERSLAIRVKTTGDHTAATAVLHVRLGDAELSLARWTDASADFALAESILVTLDPKDPQIGGARFGHARALWSSGKHAEAKTMATSARAQLEGTSPMADAIDAWLAAH